jgi:hypothetical protein
MAKELKLSTLYIGQNQMQSQSRAPKTFLGSNYESNTPKVCLDHIVIPGDGDGDHIYRSDDAPQPGDFVYGFYESKPYRFVVIAYVAYPSGVEITYSKASGALLLNPIEPDDTAIG